MHGRLGVESVRIWILHAQNLPELQVGHRQMALDRTCRPVLWQLEIELFGGGEGEKREA